MVEGQEICLQSGKGLQGGAHSGPSTTTPVTCQVLHRLWYCADPLYTKNTITLMSMWDHGVHFLRVGVVACLGHMGQ